MTVRKWGSEIQVNTNTNLSQTTPNIAALQDGTIVAVWSDADREGGDGSARSIKMQRFAADGTPLGVEMLVNTTTFLDQTVPDVVALVDGSYVVTWVDGSAFESGGDNIVFRRFNADGTPIDAVDRMASLRIVVKAVSIQRRPRSCSELALRWLPRPRQKVLHA